MDTIIYAMTHPKSICAVVAPTFGDIRRVCFGGESGILANLPKECLLEGRGQGYNSSAQEIRLWNGSKIMGFSATEPDRLRGPQFHRAWCDEIAAWQYPDAFDQLMFGLRLGDDPRCVITTTPKPVDLIRRLVARKHSVITRGSTFDNAANLAASALHEMKEKYEGTRLGRQELYADILDDTEGALWSYSMIAGNRATTEQMGTLNRIVVAIDPSVTNHEDSDETGIVVAGRSDNGHYYVLEDGSQKASPDTWARKAVELYYIHRADRIIAETNNGGDLVERVIRTVDMNVSYSSVHASRGKMVRAEPIAALYEQKKVHHVGEFKELEDQLISYTPNSKKSPDRLDALVWALTELSASTGQPVWRIS
jgi:predicted phage terminase large subunit-like protein